MADTNESIVALDIGAARIGVALASTAARFASPVGALKHDDAIVRHLQMLCERENARRLVIGLPRGLDGTETKQTRTVREFGERLARELGLPVSWQDEAVTSVQAEAELRARHKPYQKGDIDALAATYILEDYLHENV